MSPSTSRCSRWREPKPALLRFAGRCRVRVTAVPFLVGAALIGAALIVAGPRVGQVYAGNLMGSAADAIAAILVVSRFAVPQMHWAPLGLTLLATALLIKPSVARQRAARLGLAIVTMILLIGLAVVLNLVWPLIPDYDEHKYASRLQQLAAQGNAKLVAADADPHGHVALYASKLFHDLPFLAISEPPPPMYSLVINGDPGGSIPWGRYSFNCRRCSRLNPGRWPGAAGA
jgi:hypothetical protein